MESIARYFGVGGGSTQRIFKQDTNVVHQRMLRSPIEHVLVGFGQREYIQLLGTWLSGEARTVLSSFLDEWNFEDVDTPNRATAQDAEVRRQQWRDQCRVDTCYRTQQANFGFDAAPPLPKVDESRDVERLFDAIEARFRSSALDDLNLIQQFMPEDNETAEHMFPRFNHIAKPLEDERPRLMTRDQLKTTYMVQLRLLLSIDDFMSLSRDVRDCERERTHAGHDPLTRPEIHELVLRQAREKANEDIKLRAFGLSSF